MTLPLVSIIVPTFNHQDYIETALLSIISQDYRPLELIVIDDGSTDETVERTARLLAREMPQAIHLKRENWGAHNTINQGLRIASGRYITILNSDDFYLPGRLSTCVRMALNSDSEFVFTGTLFVDGDGNEALDDEYIRAIRTAEARSSSYPSLGYALLRNQLAISTGNFFFSKGLLAKVGRFRHYRYVHDWDFLLRALFFTEPLFLRDPLYAYRFHGSNSYKSLGEIEGYETSEVMRNCLWQLVSRVPENPHAPSPHFWPGLFELFVEQAGYHVYLPPIWHENGPHR